VPSIAITQPPTINSYTQYTPPASAAPTSTAYGSGSSLAGPTPTTPTLTATSNRSSFFGHLHRHRSETSAAQSDTETCTANLDRARSIAQEVKKQRAKGSRRCGRGTLYEDREQIFNLAVELSEADLAERTREMKESITQSGQQTHGPNWFQRNMRYLHSSKRPSIWDSDWITNGAESYFQRAEEQIVHERTGTDPARKARDNC